MFKRLQVKPPAEFTINTLEDIEVERGRDTLSIVIGRDEDLRRFFQVDSQEKDVFRSHDGCRTSEELGTFLGGKVSQTGPEEGHGFFLQLKGLNYLRLARKI